MPLGQDELARLIVRIVGDTDELRKEVNKGKDVISGFASSIKKILAGMGFALITKKIIDLTKESIDLMDTMSKTAQKVGETTESLSALAYAADLADVDLGRLTVGLRTLAKNMYDAQQDTGEAKEVFKELGIEVETADGKLKGASEILLEIAGKMESLDDDTKKAAYAQRIFGRSGADLIPLLNQGAEGIRKLTEEARDFGAVIDTQAAQQAEEFNDNLKRLQYSLRGLFIQLATDLLPALIDITEAVINLRKESGALDDGISLLAFAFKGIFSAALGVVTVFQTLGKLWAAQLNMWLAWKTKGLGAIKEIIEYGKIAKEDIEDLWLRMGNAINRIWNPLERVRVESKKTGTAMGKDLKEGAEGAKDAVDKMKEALDAISEKTKDLRLETIALVDPLRAASLELDLWISKTTEAVKEDEVLRGKIQELKDAFWELQEVTARINLQEALEDLDTTVFTERSKTALVNLQAQYRANRITAAEYYDGVLGLAKEAYDRETEAIQNNISMKQKQYDALVNEMITKGESLEITAKMRQTEAEWAELQKEMVEKRGEWTRQEILLLEQKSEAIRLFKLEQLRSTRAILADMASLSMGIYDLTGGRMKAFFYVARAIQFAQAIMDAYSAYTRTIGQMGFFGIPQANVVLSLGLAKAALIAAQTITGMERGGQIKGGSGRRDDVPILAMEGEYMLDKSTVRYYGLGFMEALRRHLIPRNMFSLYGGLQPHMVYGRAAQGGLIAGSETKNLTVNVPVTMEDTRLGARLKAGIEKTVISIMRDYSR